MLNKPTLLQLLLIGGGLYYLTGAVAHFFGLTLFPFYVSELYAPYHDTVIALASIGLALVMFAIAKNPAKNLDVLHAVIAGGILAIAFSVAILLRVDFEALGAPAKKIQTVVEMVLLIIYIVSLIALKPKRP